MIAGLVRACHPAPTAAVTAVTTGLAVSSGRVPVDVLLVASAALAGQLSVGWLNDYLDADTDAAAGRVGKPIVAGRVTRATVGRAAVLAALACVPLSLAAAWVAGWLHLLAVAVAWAYNVRLKFTVLSVLPYAVCFGLLPVFVVLPVAPVPWWLVTAAALLGAGAHFANVLPDLAADAATGVRGLPQRIGAPGGRACAAALLLAGSAVLAAGIATTAGAVVAAVAALALALGAMLRPEALFRAVLLVALLDAALLVASGTAVG